MTAQESIARACSLYAAGGFDPQAIVIGVGLGLELARRHPGLAAEVYELMREPIGGEPREQAESRWQSIAQWIADGVPT